MFKRSNARVRALMALAVVSLLMQGVTFYRPATASAPVTPSPTSVTIAGDLQSELGCSGDWDPAAPQPTSLRCRRRRMAGHVHRSRGQLELQGCPQQ